MACEATERCFLIVRVSNVLNVLESIVFYLYYISKYGIATLNGNNCTGLLDLNKYKQYLCCLSLCIQSLFNGRPILKIHVKKITSHRSQVKYLYAIKMRLISIN